MPPPVNEPCTVLDQGSASCEFMRCTLNELPTKPESMNMVRVPIALVWQPFAELAGENDGPEPEVPLLDRGEAGPLRCSRCRAYVNPFFTWREGSRAAICNLCGQHQPLSDEFRYELDDRPELRLGTVDYLAPRDYSDAFLPSAPVIVLALDASARSVRSGFFAGVLQTLRQLVGFLEAPSSRLALIVFDDVLHFYSIRACRREAQEVTVLDVDDPFVPCGDGELCVDVCDPDIGAQLDALLERLPQDFADTTVASAAGGAALSVAVDLAAACGGGHVVMLHAELPTRGLGALKPRDLLPSQKEPADGMLRNSAPGFFGPIHARCNASGIAVSAVCAPGAGEYIDLTSLSYLPRRTGGDILYLPGFDPCRDGEQLHYTISRTVAQADAFSCVCKVRCSKGFTPDELYTTWDAGVDDSGSFAVPRLSRDATAVMMLTHSERSEGQYAYFQAACLHTKRSGQRCIRVQTLRIKLGTRLTDAFKYVDLEALACLLLRQAAAAALGGDGGFKERITKVVVELLHAYRAHCASTSRSKTAHLVLPEALTYLPMYLLSIRKLPALRSSSGIRIDERVAGLLGALSMPVATVPTFLYPSIYSLPQDGSWARMDGAEAVEHLPPTEWCSAQKLEADTVYLIDAGLALHVYVGPGVDPSWLERLFATACAADLGAAAAAWSSAPPTAAGAAVLKLCQQIRRHRRRQPWLPLSVVQHGTPEEARLLPRLVEDTVAHEPCYVDFLVFLHREVRDKSYS